MDLRQLRYFEAVARHRHFTRAADELHVAQSAVSHQVQRLEQELGIELLRRTTRSVEPTEAGALVAARARAVRADGEALPGEGEALRGLVRGRLAVGALGVAVLPRSFAELPGPRVTVRPLQPTMRMEVVLWWLRGRRLSPAARAFVEFTVARARRAQPERRSVRARGAAAGRPPPPRPAGSGRQS